MLGYIRVQTPELRIREYECYRSIYCGLCRHMGKCTGQCSRMSLSYDFVFLAAVRMSLLGEELKQKKIRCLLHPFKRRMAVADSKTLRYCADASALLTYHKCRDDVTDEKGFKKLGARLVSRFFKGGYKRAKKRYPDLDRVIREQLTALRAYELDTTAPPSADAPAEFFANLMEAVFAEGLEGSDARIASQIGRSIGHWIYLADAADDFAKDRESGAFNPYLRLFGNAPEESDWKATELAMKALLTQAECAFLLIDRYPNAELREILCNIFYLSLPDTAEAILKRNLKGETERHENSL